MKPNFDFQEHTENMQNEAIENLEEYLCKNYLDDVPECKIYL